MSARPRPPFSVLTAFGGTSLDTVVTVPHFIGSDDKVWGAFIGRFPGGMGANVAAVFAALGGEARLVSAVGNDAAGEESLATLRQLKVDITRVARGPGSTFETLAMIDATGEKAMLLLMKPDMAEARPTVDEPRPGIDGLHVVPGRFSPPIERLADWRRRGVHVSFDIEPSMLEGGLDYPAVLAAASVVFCGERAGEAMSSAGSAAGRVRDLLEAGPDVVALTRGRHGAIVGSRSGELVEVPPADVKPINTTGAGDAFAGAFLAGLARGWPLGLCASAANTIAGRCAESHASQDPNLSIAVVEHLPGFPGQER